MTSLFSDPSSYSVSREMIWWHIRVQTRAASGALARAFETAECKGISKKIFPRTYLADTERHQEPAAHRCRRQKPPHRDGHFAGMTRARALLTASQNVSHSPKDPPKVSLSRHIFLVLREESHRTHAGIPWRDS